MSSFASRQRREMVSEKSLQRECIDAGGQQHAGGRV